MSRSVVWTALARQDLIDIYVTIGLDNPSAAGRVYDSLEARADRLADTPRIGVRRPDIRPAVRMIVEGTCLIPL